MIHSHQNVPKSEGTNTTSPNFLEYRSLLQHVQQILVHSTRNVPVPGTLDSRKYLKESMLTPNSQEQGVVFVLLLVAPTLGFTLDHSPWIKPSNYHIHGSSISKSADVLVLILTLKLQETRCFLASKQTRLFILLILLHSKQFFLITRTIHNNNTLT